MAIIWIKLKRNDELDFFIIPEIPENVKKKISEFSFWTGIRNTIRLQET